jgi:hypothetical protein
MAGELWDKPDPYPNTPAFDAEGAPVDHAAASGALVNYNDATNREAQRALGVLYAETNGEIVEAGIANLWRRALYAEWKRVSELLFLAVGPVGWTPIWTISGDYGITNFANVHGFVATGSGHTWHVTWTPPNDDLRSLSSSPNEIYDEFGESYDPPRYWRWAGQPGLVLLTERWAAYGMVEVYDIVFTGTGSATITTDPRRDLPACDGWVWLIREHALPSFPFGQLYPTIAETTSPVQCRHAVQAAHSGFASFKTTNPSAYTSAGIHGAAGATWYCAKMDQADTDLSGFVAAEGRCNKTTCPNYSAITPSVPGPPDYSYYPNDFNYYLLASGVYIRELIAGGGGGANLVIGRDLWPGMASLIGMKTGYYATSLALTYCNYNIYGEGFVHYRTGNKTAAGYDEFLSWEDYQQKLRDADTEETDAFWPWGGSGGIANSATGKVDAAGGASPADRLLVQDAARTPGWIFEKAIGFRRVGGRGFEQGTGVTSYPDGWGEAMVQRARPRKYTSGFFAHPKTSGTYYSEETMLVFYATPQPLGGDSAFTFDTTWKVPRFGEIAATPTTRKGKAVSGTIASATISGNLLTVDYELGSETCYYAGVELPSCTFDCGGNVVCGDNAWEISNPGSTRRMGDRQDKLYPGDLVAHTGLPALTVVSAMAYGGSVDATADAPIAALMVVGLPHYVYNNHAHRDRVIYALEGASGEVVRAALATLPGRVITSATHGAIAPPSFGYTGAATGYAPVLKKVTDKATVATLTPGTDYVFDPNTGTFYVNRTGWPSASCLNFHAEMWLMDARQTYPCETAQHMRRITDKICEGYVAAGNLGSEVLRLNYFEKRDSLGAGMIYVASPGSIAVGGSEPYEVTPVDFSGTAGSRSWHRMRYPTATWTTGLFAMSSEKEPPYRCGIIPHLMPGKVNHLGYHLDLASMFPITPLVRGGATAIKTATINLDVMNGLLDEWQGDLTVEGGLVETINTQTDDVSLMRLRGIVVKLEDDGRYSFIGDAGLSDGGTLAPIVVDEITYYRGTLEITTMLKASYALALAQPNCHIMLFWAPPTGGVEGNEEIGNFLDWILSWSETFDEDGEPLTGHAHYFSFSYDSMSDSSPMVQFDPDYLSGGPDLHFDSTGHVSMPDLLYDPGPVE